MSFFSDLVSNTVTEMGLTLEEGTGQTGVGGNLGQVFSAHGPQCVSSPAPC